MAMFNRDSMLGKKDEGGRSDARGLTATQSEPSRAEGARTYGGGHGEAPGSATAARGKEDVPGSKLIVGPHIKLKGVEITDCDTLVVEGRVEASMDSRVVQIAEGGVFTGTVTMDVAEIRGRFEGKLTARKQLVIHASGRVSGEIRYGTIRIEEGGELSGQISTLGTAHGEAAATQSRTDAADAAARAGKPPLGGGQARF